MIVMEIQNTTTADFTNISFWKKIRNNGKSAGKVIIEKVLMLYYSAMDKDTPKWAKGVILGALAYFIMPIDAIPDFIPVVGFSDDLITIIGAISAVAIHIKDEHKKKAKEITTSLFGD